ncbi:kinase-like domain-containing protein [Epithele typhae]|uniref:kinase-like domain-containing protein n=1 Tax=Epithele typhae TaxID=378194 RepID=UPI002008C71B|nr:kinase-like domain-containing protein [Epithele typhae]KAH9923768.1 kinase-like domain-containing protein [Epithele typhae]
MAAGLSWRTKMLSPWWRPASNSLEHGGTSVPVAPSRHPTFMPMYDGSTLSSFTKLSLPDVDRHYGIALLIAKMIGTRWIVMRMVSRTFVVQARSDFRQVPSFVFTPVTLDSSASLATPSPLQHRPRFARATPPNVQWRLHGPTERTNALGVDGCNQRLSVPPPLDLDPPQGDVRALDDEHLKDAVSDDNDGQLSEPHNQPDSQRSENSNCVSIIDVIMFQPSTPAGSPVQPRATYDSTAATVPPISSLPLPDPLTPALALMTFPEEPAALRPDIDYRSLCDPFNLNRERRNDVVFHDRDSYTILGTLGSGAFGRVFAACKNLNQVVAVKATHKWKHYRRSRGFRASLLRERDFMMLAAIHDIAFWTQLQASWEDDHNVYFVMDLCLGNLAQRLRECDRRPIDAKRMCAEMVLAVSYLETLQIIHGDIKPENFLITSDNDHLVLADFGVSNRLLDPQMSFDDFHLDRTGTAEFMSRETLCQEETYHKSDIFSLGLVFFQVFLRSCIPVLDFDRQGPPLPDWLGTPEDWFNLDLIEWQIRLRSVQSVINFDVVREEDLPRTSAEWKLCAKMTHGNRALRPSASELRRDEYFGEAFMLEVYNDARVAQYQARNGNPGASRAAATSLERMKSGPDDRDLGFSKWHRGDGSYYDAHAEFVCVYENAERRVWLRADARARQSMHVERSMGPTEEMHFVAPPPLMYPPSPLTSRDELEAALQSVLSTEPDGVTDVEYPGSDGDSDRAQLSDDGSFYEDESVSSTPSCDRVPVHVLEWTPPPSPLRLPPVTAGQRVNSEGRLEPEVAPTRYSGANEDDGTPSHMFDFEHH